MISLINPYTNTLIATRNYSTSEELSKQIKCSDEAYHSWRKTSVEQRIDYIKEVLQIISKQSAELAVQMTKEMGKPVSQAEAEIQKCILLCTYYIEHAKEFLEDIEVYDNKKKAIIRKQSLGVILGVMPWNFPFWQVFRFAIPTLLSGNTVLLKHADNVQLSAEAIENCFLKAGFPKGVFTNICVTHEQVAQLIKSTPIKGVSLTGSNRAGKAVASLAAKEIKPSLLELGGSNALIVMPDAPLKATIKLCIKARFQNTGQSCIAGKRLLLHKAIYKDFIDLLIEEVAQLSVGNPEEKSTFVSVLAREDLAVNLKKQLDDSVAMGAKISFGGKQHKAFFEPCIVEGVTSEMPIFKEETFGPLLAVTSFNDLEEAIQLSNNSIYGLGVSIFTKDTDAIIPYLNDFEEGAISINDFVKSDPKLPFGGVKKSGYGRELAKDGLLSFVNLQTIQIHSIE